MFAVWSVVMICGWMLLYAVSERIYGLIAPKLMSRLSLHDVVEWRSRTISTIHAILSFVLALNGLIMFRDEFSKDKINTWSWYFEVTTAVSNSYMLYEMILAKLYPCVNWLMRCAMALILFALQYFEKAAYFSNMLMLTEFTTPFVNFRWFLAVAKLKHHPAYKVNGVFVWLSFFVVRVVGVTHLLVTIFLKRNSFPEDNPMVFYVCLFGVGVAFSLNTFWFALITKAVVRVVCYGKGEGTEIVGAALERKDRELKLSEVVMLPTRREHTH